MGRRCFGIPCAPGRARAGGGQGGGAQALPTAARVMAGVSRVAHADQPSNSEETMSQNLIELKRSLLPSAGIDSPEDVVKAEAALQRLGDPYGR